MNNGWRRLRVHHGPGTPDMDDPSWTAAFASNDRKHVDQHFGMATGFDLYAISPGGSRLIEVLRAVSGEANSHEGRVGARVRLLEGCRLLFCIAVGEAAKQQLAAVGITAMVVDPGTPIAALLIKLQEQSASRAAASAGGPAPCGKARSSRQAEENFLAMLANGWDE
ncbi:MAG: nitrogen fixation protein NifX [Magnetococcales bacterium]|nr:nitrogen fixation protein NifX [Magnetococcales bacterium]